MPESRLRTIWRRHRLLVVLSVLAVALIAYVGIALAAAETLTKPRRRSLVSSPAVFDLVYEEVTFDSRGDGIPLRGWFLPAPGSDRVGRHYPRPQLDPHR